MIGVLSRGIVRIAHLAEFLGQPWEMARSKSAEKYSHIVGWGLKPTAEKARAFAGKHQLPYVSLEDGFLRSVGLGNDDQPLSLVVDDAGIYYDATRPSSLESLIASSLSKAQTQRAADLAQAWRAARVSKYNHAPEFCGDLSTPYVLAVDQTYGDASLQYGMADPASFTRMLDAALAENPDCDVWLKIHPEAMAGRKRAHFDLAALAQHPRIRVLSEDVHPASLLEHCRAVYVVTSQMGFEGLLWGKRVRTFGMPFYAGWGLTEDALPAPQRRHPVAFENLIHAALIAYARYVDPETGKRCEVEQVLAHLALQRRMLARFSGPLHALGFSEWKKPIVRSFFGGSAVVFHGTADDIPGGATVALWGRKPFSGTLHNDISVVRLEDGFIRSVGLGADLIRPMSWVMDCSGIYYDSTVSSDLEDILQQAVCDPAMLARARTLRLRLVEENLTKYNVGKETWSRFQKNPLSDNADQDMDVRIAPSRTIILVPGQVESDASLLYGAPVIRRNFDLLCAVRQANPDAYIVYKPHPDVVAGLRGKGDGEDDARAYCDEVVIDVAMGTLLMQIDEVHTLTSLTGFEALLRGKKVVCYGQPFYAGWGLTQDVLPHPRRTRILSLDELVAGALISYPVYVSRTTGRFTTPERALDELLVWRDAAPTQLPFWRKVLRRVLGWVKA